MAFKFCERALVPWIFLALPLLSLPLGAHTQAPAPNPPPSLPQSAPSAGPIPSFDVAAIHVHESLPGENNIIKGSPVDGRLHTENIRVITLIHWAYEMPDMRILGAPAWTNSTHFNIDARSSPEVDERLHNLPDDVGRKLKEKMVQKLLADRFRLVTHFETREMPIYQLIAAKGGPKLGVLQESGPYQDISNGRIDVRGPNSVALLAEELSKIAGRDVIDKTGLAGNYRLALRFSPDEGPSLFSGQPDPNSPPPLFTALEEQLGLKLEPAKGPVPVLVIDHIEMPTAN